VSASKAVRVHEPLSDVPDPARRSPTANTPFSCSWPTAPRTRKSPTNSTANIHTIKGIVRRVYARLGARDRAHAVALAYHRGILIVPRRAA
jgi:hypothetical protein